MSEPNTSTHPPRTAFLPAVALLPLTALLILSFILLLFPWDSLGRRIAWEISRVSGARVEVPELAPGVSARGPVLRARDVTITHPAIDRIRLSTLEIAPRFSTSWFEGNPTLRIWAQTQLGQVDGVLRLGTEPAYLGRVSEVELSRLPLRMDSDQLRFVGKIAADADVALSPNGTLQGKILFDSEALEVQTGLLPISIPFSRATGTLEILQSGATRISAVDLEGPMIDGRIEGEIGLVHRSQAPPIDLSASLRIHDPTLQDMAQRNGFPKASGNETNFHLGGTIISPEITPLRPGSTR